MKSDTAYLPRGELSYFMGYVSAKKQSKTEKGFAIREANSILRMRE